MRCTIAVLVAAALLTAAVCASATATDAADDGDEVVIESETRAPSAQQGEAMKKKAATPPPPSPDDAPDDGTLQHVYRKAKAKRLKDEQMWMDGLTENANINCPSLRMADSRDFHPPKQTTTSLRCATCQLMREYMVKRAQLIMLRGRTPSAAYVLDGDDDKTRSAANKVSSDEFCQSAYESYHLKERATGARVWMRRDGEKDEDELDAERAALLQSHLVASTGDACSSGGEQCSGDLLPVKFHTPEERRHLPCARFFFKQLCLREISRNDEPLEGCFDMAVTRIAKRFVTGGDRENTSVAQGAKLTASKSDIALRDDWSTVLGECLDKVLQCSSRFCNSRLVAIAMDREWTNFAWYEGAFGNDKLPYVVDPENRGRNMLNPYRKGGEKAAANPWLNGTWTKLDGFDEGA